MKQNLEFPIGVTFSTQGTPGTGIALSLLSEISTMLESLIDTGKTDSIDLRRTPLEPDDFTILRDILGHGELNARAVDTLGKTHIEETAISGVWWLTYYSDDHKVLGEFIEVTKCPAMLSTSDDDLHVGLNRLHAQLTTESVAVDPNTIAKSMDALGLVPSSDFQDILSSHQEQHRGEGYGK